MAGERHTLSGLFFHPTCHRVVTLLTAGNDGKHSHF